MSSSQQQKENKQNQNSRQEEEDSKDSKDSKDQSQISQNNQNHSKQKEVQIQQKLPQIKVIRFQTQNYEYQFYYKNQIIKIEVDLLENNQISIKYLEGFVKNQRFANITNPCFQSTRQAIQYIEDTYDQSNRQFLQEKFKIQMLPAPIIQKNQIFDAKMTVKVLKNKQNGSRVKRQIIFNLSKKTLNSQAERDKRIKQKGALTIQMLKIKQEKQKYQFQKKIKQSEEQHNAKLKQLLENMVKTNRISTKEAKKFKKSQDQSEQQSKQEEKSLRKRQNQSSCVQIYHMKDKNQDFINEEQEKRSIYDYRSQIFQSQKKIRQQQLQQVQKKQKKKQKQKKIKKKKKDQKKKKKNRIPLQSKLQQLAQISQFVNDSADNNGNLSQKQKEIDNYIEKLKKMHLQQFSQEYVSKQKKKQSSSSSSQSSDDQKELVYDSTLVAQLKKQLEDQLQQQKKSRRKKKKNKKDKKIKKDRKRKKHKHKSKKHKKKIYDSSTSEDQEQIIIRKIEESQAPSVGTNFFKYLSQDLQESNNNNHLAPVQSYQFSDYHTPVAALHQQSSDLRPLRPIRSKKSTVSDAPSMNPIYRPNNSIFAKPSRPAQEGQSQFIQIIKIPIQFMKDIAPYSNFEFSGNRVTKRGGYGCQQIIINFPIPRIGRYSISATVIQSRKLYFWFGVIDIRQRDRTQTYTYANSICFSFRTGVIVANRKWQRQRTGRLKIGQTVRMQIDMSNYSVSWHVNDGKVAIVQMPKKMRKMILVPYFQIMEIGDIIQFS